MHTTQSVGIFSVITELTSDIRVWNQRTHNMYERQPVYLTLTTKHPNGFMSSVLGNNNSIPRNHRCNHNVWRLKDNRCLNQVNVAFNLTIIPQQTNVVQQPVTTTYYDKLRLIDDIELSTYITEWLSYLIRLSRVIITTCHHLSVSYIKTRQRSYTGWQNLIFGSTLPSLWNLHSCNADCTRCNASLRVALS